MSSDLGGDRADWLRDADLQDTVRFCGEEVIHVLGGLGAADGEDCRRAKKHRMLDRLLRLLRTLNLGPLPRGGGSSVRDRIPADEA